MTTKSPIKKARNIERAAQRLAKLQATQRLGSKLRTMGYIGTDKEVIEQYEQAKAQANAKSWCDQVFAIPYTGTKIRHWLATRINQDPLDVKKHIEAFLARDGKNGKYDNTLHMLAVRAAFSTAPVVQITPDLAVLKDAA